MPIGHLAWAINVPNAKTRCGIGSLWHVSLVLPLPVPAILMARAHSSLRLCLHGAHYVNRYAYQMGQGLQQYP